jgi:hypothetical protein
MRNLTILAFLPIKLGLGLGLVDIGSINFNRLILPSNLFHCICYSPVIISWKIGFNCTILISVLCKCVKHITIIIFDYAV